MRDPLYHQDLDPDRADSGLWTAVMRMQGLKLATGAVALVLLAAIWIVWRWG